jgi:hypothetical protein
MAAEVAAGITQGAEDDALIAGAFGEPGAAGEEDAVVTQGGVGIDPTLSVEPPEPGDGEQGDGFPPAPTGPIPEEPGEGDEPEEPEEPDEDGTVTLPDGSVVSIGRLRELAQLDAAFRTNPAIQGAVERAVRENGLLPGATPAPAIPQQQPVGGIPGGYPQGAVPPPPPAAPPAVPQFAPLPTFEFPADVDPQDPTVMWVQAQQRAMAEQNQQLMAGQQAILTNMQQQAQATAVSSLERARADFQGRYPTLSFDDVAQIEAQAGARGLGGHFMRQYGDPYKAALDSLELQAGAMPELRPKLYAAAAAAAAGGNVTPIDRQKQATKAKAHRAIAGKGGTAPRTEPAQPRKLTENEKVAAMADVIAQATQAN